MSEGQPGVRRFLPSTFGLHFANAFPHVPMREVRIGDVATLSIGDAANGLCGGMSFTVADLYHAGVAPPPDTSPPSDGPRFESIVDRQVDSFADGTVPLRFYSLMDPSRPDREPAWAPWAGRLGIDRHSRTYVMVHEEWPGIRAALDAGQLVVLGLVRVVDRDPRLLGRNHQVVAYGYELDGSALTVHIYDPNVPDGDGVTLSLDVSDPGAAVSPVYSGPGPAVVCFFRSPYAPADPVAWRPTTAAGETDASIALAGPPDAAGATPPLVTEPPHAAMAASGPPWRVVRAVAGVLATLALVAGTVALAASGTTIDTSPVVIARVAVLLAISVGILGVARYGGEGYFAALWVFAPLAPVVAAAISVVSYLLLPDPTAAIPDEPVLAVELGLAIALATWFLSGFPGAALASRDRAQLRAFNQLVQRHGVLAARARAEREQRGRQAPAALVEAETCIGYVGHELHDPSRGGPALRWVLSSGYTGLTRQLHRAEEALIAVEPVSDLVGDVLHDDLSLEDSAIRNRFALRRVIRDALPVISASAAQVLLRPVPALPPASAGAPATGAAAAAPGAGAPAAGAPAPGAAATAAVGVGAQPAPAVAAGTPGASGGPASVAAIPAATGATPVTALRLTEGEARQALREVRFAINEYRDDIVDSFARGRNRLIWTYLAVSISTYVFLGLGLVYGIPRSALLSVSVLYLVASLIGLFSRLRIEASHTPRVDDYGLYLARLMTGPLLSGLAGVAGVYLIAQTPAFLGPLTTTSATGVEPPAPKTLAEIYDITTNQLAILVAAVFGLAPGLLTTRLQDQVDRLERDLARSEPATSTPTSGQAGGGPSEDDGG